MNGILKLYDQKFIKDLFREKVLPKYPQFVDIKKIEIQKHKTHIWEHSWHVVAEFKTYLFFGGMDS